MRVRLQISAQSWLLALLVLIALPVYADLIFTSPPREGGGGNDNADDFYIPFAKYLSSVIGQKVVYENPSNWLNYQAKMKEDKYDIIFDGPHFIAWRIVHLDNEAIVRMPGPLDFTLYTRKSEDSVNKLEDMVAQSFCTIPPPNLGTLALLDKFRNPVRQPVLKSIGGGVQQIVEAFKEGKCKAALVRSNYYAKKISDEEKKNLKVIFKTGNFPNQGFSVSKRVSVQERAQLKQALTSTTPDATVLELVKRFGKPEDRLIPTDNKEFEGYNNLLEGVIYGW
ncbi:MAG: PhnD/SsuA/transferrin family substrate-binding protein [Gammaproteobacteria bacterium]|nr:PhnD/SsuA/transferrin family substrate-binding protein [Gammaproteobacteria bacterium]